jgi:hypothetical protein
MVLSIKRVAAGHNKTPTSTHAQQTYIFKASVLLHFRIDHKEDRHLNFLVGLQLLLFKAKTLNFVKVQTRFGGDDIVPAVRVRMYVCECTCVRVYV